MFIKRFIIICILVTLVLIPIHLPVQGQSCRDPNIPPPPDPLEEGIPPIEVLLRQSAWNRYMLTPPCSSSTDDSRDPATEDDPLDQATEDDPLGDVEDFVDDPLDDLEDFVDDPLYDLEATLEALVDQGAKDDAYDRASAVATMAGGALAIGGGAVILASAATPLAVVGGILVVAGGATGIISGLITLEKTKK